MSNGTWTNPSGGNWSTTGNWSGGIVADGAGSTANFSTINIGLSPVNVTLDTISRTVGTFLVGDTTSTFHAYNFASTGGATLTFDNNGNGAVLTETAASGQNFFDSTLALVLGDNLTINNYNTAGGGTGPLRISGGITGAFNLTLNANGADGSHITLETTSINNSGTITNSGSGTGTTTISALIGSNVMGVTQNSAGSTLALTNAGNSYSGNTIILSGTISIDADATLGDGTGTLFLSGGTLATTANRPVADVIANNISLTADSSIITTSNATTVLANFTGTLVGNAGTLTIENVGANGATDTFTARFSGGTFSMSRPIVVTAAVGRAQLADFNTTGTTHTYDGAISGNGAFIRSATVAGTGGTTVFNAANTYTGTTTVSSGTLLVNGSLASGSAVTVSNSGSVIGGTGTINGSVSIASSGARLQGGTGSTGQTLTMTGAVTMSTGSIMQLALGTSGAHSTLAISGGTLSFASNQAFAFIDLGATTGIYQDIITGLPGTPNTSPSTWTITNSGWTGTFTFDGNNIDLNLTAVPEPSAWMAGALAAGVVGWSLLRRFAQKLKSETLKADIQMVSC